MMTAYKFYLRNERRGFELIGILIERRIDPARITEESIINWWRKIFSMNTKPEDILYIKTHLDEGEYRNSLPVHHWTFAS